MKLSCLSIQILLNCWYKNTICWCHSCGACTTCGMYKIISTTEMFSLADTSVCSINLSTSTIFWRIFLTNALLHGNYKNGLNPCFAKTFCVVAVYQYHEYNMKRSRQCPKNSCLHSFADLSELEYKILCGQVLPYMYIF